MPALEDALGPGVAAALARSAAQLSADCDALDEIAAAESWRIVLAPGDPAGGDGTGHAVVVVDIDGLAELATAVRSRVLRQAALAAGCPAGSLAASHVAALDALVTGWHGQRWADLPGVIRARRRYGKLLFSKGRPAGAGPPAPTEAEAAGGRD
jgi:tRNA(Ile)-lysidine synthase